MIILYYLLFIAISLLFVAIIAISLEFLYKLYYKKVVGAIVLSRWNNTIYTILSIVTLMRYSIKGNKVEFKKDCDKFFKSLKEGVVYTTETHAVLLRAIKNRCKKENVSYIETKKRSMFLSKLFIGNIQNLFSKNKAQYYKVTFKI